MSYESFVGVRYFRGRRGSIITLISVGAVAVGVAALIVVLSVMRGFEDDLKTKILGTYAHVLVDPAVTDPAAPKPAQLDASTGLADWRAMFDRVAAVPGVVSAGPFVRDEIMVSSPTNLAGVTLKGVRTQTAAKVNGLGATMVEGKLAHLDDPRQIRRVGLLEIGPGSPNLRDEVKASPPLPDPSDPPPPGGEIELMPALDAPSKPDRVLPGVVIGKELKRNLLVTVGDIVTLVSPLGDLGPTGPIPKARSFRVAGVFYTGMYEYDTRIVYTTIPEAQRFLGMADEVSGIEIKTSKELAEETGELAVAVAKAAGPGVRVRDWRQLNESLFSALKLERIAMFIILTFIVLVASFNIVSNLILVVLEKAQEIAILKSLGASDLGVLRVFVVQGLVIGGLGAAVGLALGVGLALFVATVGIPLDPEVYYIDSLPIVIEPLELVVTSGSAVLIALLAALYPAWKAAQLTPVEGLRLG